MKENKIFKLRNLKILSITFLVLDFIIAILSPFLIKYNYLSIAKLSLLILYDILIPLTGILMIITFIYNLKAAYTEKRTKKQELIIKQNFWGRMSLLALSIIIMFIYILFRELDIIGFLVMFLLFIFSIIFGPRFGRLIIKK